MQGTYRLNQETQRVELHFAKEDYKAMPAEQQAELKSKCQYSGLAGCWISRTRQPLMSGHYWAVQLAKKLGLTEEETVGEALSIAEQQERKQERAADRADRMSDRASAAHAESNSRYNSAIDRLSVIPMGQPILIGHHSEAGHRNRLARADNDMRASFAAEGKAKHYEDRAGAAQHTALAKELKDPAFLTRRIKEHEANLRKMERGLLRAKEENHEGNIAHYEGWAAQYREKLAYYRELLEAAGGASHTPDGLRESRAGYLLYEGLWYPVKRLATKSVTVINWLGIADFTWSVPYAEIKGVRPVDAPEVVYDRDKNPVKPSIKY